MLNQVLFSTPFTPARNQLDATTIFTSRLDGMLADELDGSTDSSAYTRIHFNTLSGRRIKAHIDGMPYIFGRQMIQRYAGDIRHQSLTEFRI
jgi:hypothetical protein